MRSTSSRMAAFRCIRISTALFFTLALPSQAGGIDLRQALENAFAHNKQISAFRFQIAAQEGQRLQAGLLPNPKVDLLFENLAGSGDFRGFDSAETTLSIGWAIEPGIRDRRIEVADERSAQTRLDAELLRLDVAAETAQRFLSSLEGQAHLIANEEAVALGEQTVAAIERRVRAGKAATAELLRARAELATDRLAHDDVTHELSVAYHKLAAQWGETTPSFSRVEGDLMKLPVVAPFDEFVVRLDRNPTLARLASEERVAAARVRLVEARRWPTLTPSVGIRRLEATDDWALVAGVSVPMPLFDRQQGRLVESRATLARTRADADAQRVRVHTALFEIYQEMRHSVHTAEALRDEVIPRFEEATNEVRQGYERGRYPYSELRTIQKDLRAARRSAVEASTAAHRLVITLEQLTGERASK